MLNVFFTKIKGPNKEARIIYYKILFTDKKV